jgi:hypothetical protein
MAAKMFRLFPIPSRILVARPRKLESRNDGGVPRTRWLLGMTLPFLGTRDEFLGATFFVARAGKKIMRSSGKRTETSTENATKRKTVRHDTTGG